VPFFRNHHNGKSLGIAKLTQGSFARSAGASGAAVPFQEIRACADDRAAICPTRVATTPPSGRAPMRTARSTMLVDQLQVLVRQHEAHVDLGICGEEVRHDRQDMKAAEQDRRRQNQFPARRFELARRLALRLVHRLEDAARRDEIVGTCIRECKSPASCAEAACAEAASSSPTLRLTLASGMRSSRAAAESCPVSTTRARIDIASRRSMIILKFEIISL
jgi:hypothetical protein